MLSRNPNADIFIPDQVDTHSALSRITHLCIAAHQDDIEILAYHGIAACFAKDDQWFGGIVVTNGAGSPRSGYYGHYTDEQMQAVRLREQRKAAYVGEYAAQIQLAYPSAIVKDPQHMEVADDLHTLVEQARPDVVYLHNPADKHDTHVAVLLRSLEAIRALPKDQRPQKAYGCEVWRDLDWLLDGDKHYLDVSQSDHLATALVGIFDSQISGGKRYDLATAGRRLANATYSSPHYVDKAKALTFALDLTPLITDETLSIEAYALSYIERFKNDVRTRIQSFQKS